MIAVEKRQPAERMRRAMAERCRRQREPSATAVVSWAIRPSATIARRFGISAIVAAEIAAMPISAAVGLFSGGTQRTALVMPASTSVSPSSGRA